MSDLLIRLNRHLSGRYRIELPLGEGGMATVYLAEDVKHGRKVAVKVLRPDLGATLGAERFLAEIRLTANLQHPHLLPLYDSGEADGLLYYVMPLVDGESLRQKLERDGPLPIDDAIRITRAVASALDYAHGQGVVHRDIKPENILLHQGEALLADFGIALAASRAGSERLTHSGLSLGTPHYMSPEQATGGRDVDRRADVYALGCVLYEMLAGEPPYPAPNATAVMAKLLVDPVPSVRRLRATVPEPVDRAISKALAKEPADRFQTAGNLAHALVPSGEVDTRTRHGRPGRRTARTAVAIALLVAIFGILSRPLTPPIPTEATRIAMLPWTVVGGEEDLVYLRDGLVYLLSASLDGVGPIRMVDPNALLAYVAAGDCVVVNPECGRRAAARFGAGRYVLGQVVPVGPERVQLLATLYSRDGASLGSVQSTASRQSPEVAIDALARALVTAESEGSQAALAGIAALTTTSLDGLKFYLDGELAFRALDVFAALDAFGRALEVDPTFALAHYRRAETAAWAARFDLVDRHVALAIQQRSRLPERARRLLEAFDLWWRGDAPAAEAAYRSFLESYPDDVTARYWLAETVLHGNALRGRPTTEAEGLFEDALALDGNLVGAVFHLAELKARAGKLLELDSLANLFVAATQESVFTLFVDVPRWLAMRDSAELQALASRASKIDDDPLIGGVFNATVFTRNLAGGRLLLTELTSTGRAPFVRAAGHLALAHLDVAQGRWADAQPHLSEADALRPGWGLEHRAYLASLPWLPRPDSELRTIRNQLAAWDAVVEASGPYDRELFLPVFLETHVGSRESIRSYVEGLLAARLGDVPAVRAAAARVDTASLPTRAGTFGPDAARTLRAFAAASEGDSAAALREVQAAEMRVTYPLMFSSPFHSRARHRYLRARLLESEGDDARALDWYAGLADQAIYDMVYLAPASLRQGEIHERRGEAALAAAHYRRFVELWTEADPELQPLVEEVRARLARLGR
jgi:serine/threonine-protein kinase